MTIPTVADLNEDSPAGSDNINQGDNRIREYKTQNREILEVEHDYPTSGNSATAGQHKQVTLQEQADLGTGAVGATILGSQTIDGKGELVYTDEDDNDVQITSGGTLFMTDIIAANNPIGTVRTFGVSTNPETLLGFTSTWVAVAGRVIVGIAASGTFDTLDATGGVETVTLTGAQSGTSAHTHLQWYNHNAGSGSESANGGSTTNRQDESTAASTEANADEAHTNLQPYIVKYIWQRTA